MNYLCIYDPCRHQGDEKPIDEEDLVLMVAKAMAPAVWLEFDPEIHGSPVNQDWAKRFWLKNARAAIDEVRKHS